MQSCALLFCVISSQTKQNITVIPEIYQYDCLDLILKFKNFASCMEGGDVLA